MRETRVTVPQLALLAGTRAAAGAGLGLLLADRLAPAQRRAVGWTLLLIGAVTTLPLAIEILGNALPESHGWEPDWDVGEAPSRPREMAVR